MPRQPRVHVPDGVYHAILRGNHRQAIFFEAADYHRFESILVEALVCYRYRLHAYCWMTNHIHMAIQVSDRPLGHLMQLVASRYARLTQREIPTTGHFFERRYHATLVACDEYLMALTRYIHLNPVRAGLAGAPNEYRWSSHAAYMGVAAPAWLTTELILGLFGGRPGDARESYRRFVEVAPGNEELDRVRHGWPDEARSAAGVSLTGALLSVPPPRFRRSLDQIVALEIARRGISLADLVGPSKLRVLSAARADIARQALSEGAATLSELASQFNRSPPAMSRLLRAARSRSRSP